MNHPEDENKDAKKTESPRAVTNIFAAVTKESNIRFFGVVILILAGIIIILWKSPDFFNNLADVDYARGIITFIIALSTMGIALVLTFSALSDSPADQAKFTRGKDIFTIMLGILGTIIGYYYGTVDNFKAPSTPVEIADIVVQPDPMQLKPNEPVSFMVLLENGIPPFKYSIEFDEGFSPQSILTRTTNNYWFHETITFPMSVTGEISFKAKISVSDQSNITMVEEKDLKITNP